jgi:hypothetical protein
MKWAALETEVSPSNFTFAANNIVCCRRVQPAAKLKLERLTLAAFADGPFLAAGDQLKWFDEQSHDAELESSWGCSFDTCPA